MAPLTPEGCIALADVLLGVAAIGINLTKRLADVEGRQLASPQGMTGRPCRSRSFGSAILCARRYTDEVSFKDDVSDYFPINPGSAS